MPTTPLDVSLSVVTGADENCIYAFLASLRESVSRLPSVDFRPTAIVNSGSRTLASSLRELVDDVRVRDTPWGFASNHNEILRQTGATYHVIANDDVLVDADALQQLVSFMERPENHRVAAVSPKLLNPDLTLQPSTYGFPTVPSVMLSWSGLRPLLSERVMRILARLSGRRDGSSRAWSHDVELDVDTFRGAFVVVRMEAVHDVGMMTEVALVGGEEVEWHARMRERGWRVVFCPDASVIHRGRVSTGGRPELEIEYVKGTLNFFASHGDLRSFRFLRLLGVLRVGVIRLRYWLVHGDAIPTFGQPIHKIEHHTARIDVRRSFDRIRREG